MKGWWCWNKNWKPQNSYIIGVWKMKKSGPEKKERKKKNPPRLERSFCEKCSVKGWKVEVELKK